MRTTIIATATISPAKPSTEAPQVVAQPRSPWHYPIPYLLGGLTTMVVLVGCALVILACSYWKRNGGGGGAERDLEPGGESVKVFKDKVLVIMAGNENPTYLATPVPLCASKATCFDEESEKEENCEKLKEAQHHHQQHQ